MTAPVTVVTKTEFLFIRNSFKKMLESHPEGEIIGVEIGVYEGINSKFMLLACPRLKLCLIDNWENLTIYTGGPVQDKAFSGVIKNLAELNLNEFGDRAIFAYQNSSEGVKQFPDNFFDYVYIDGDHEHESALKDMRLWFPKVKKGGI